MKRDYKRFDRKLVALVNEYVDNESHDKDNFDQIDYASHMTFARSLDNLAERRGWVEDRLNNPGWSDRKASKKIRRALGYSYP